MNNASGFSNFRLLTAKCPCVTDNTERRFVGFVENMATLRRDLSHASVHPH